MEQFISVTVFQSKSDGIRPNEEGIGLLSVLRSTQLFRIAEKHKKTNIVEIAKIFFI